MAQQELEGYIVANALLQADTGPEAQVGDQVKLYLNTEAEDGFPEFILGVIQHPIESVSCGTGTSYTFSYDDADLEGAAELLVLGDIVDVEVVNAAQIVADALAVETAARIAADSAETASRIAGDAILAAALLTRRPLPGTPIYAVAASLLVNPAGDDNNATYTAVATGPDGNLISIGYSASVISAITTVTVNGLIISVVPATKARLEIAGDSDPSMNGTLLYAGQLNGKAEWSSDGISTAAGPGPHGDVPFNGMYYSSGSWRASRWDGVGTTIYAASVASVANYPTGLTFVATTGTGTITIAELGSSAAQAIAAVNADPAASALVLGAASGTVTGAIAPVNAAFLVGGLPTTTALAGDQLYDANFLYTAEDDILVDSTTGWFTSAVTAL